MCLHQLKAQLSAAASTLDHLDFDLKLLYNMSSRPREPLLS